MNATYKLNKNKSALIVNGYLMEMRVVLDQDNNYAGLKPKYEAEEVLKKYCSFM